MSKSGGDGNGAFVSPCSVLLFEFFKVDCFLFSRQNIFFLAGEDPLDPLTKRQTD